MPPRVALGLSLALAAGGAGAGCSAGLPPRALWAEGRPGTAAVAVDRDRLAMQVAVNDHATAYVLVDTGALVTALDRRALPGVALDRGLVELESLRVGTLVFRDVRAVADDGAGDVRAAGRLGADVLAQYPVSLDYAGHAVVLGDAPLPDSVDPGEPAALVPFRPAGGGVRWVPGGILPRAMAATRVLVPARIEGRACTMVVDTGLATVLLDDAAFDALASDGRATLRVPADEPTAGALEGQGVRGVRATGALPELRVARARSVRVGDAEVHGLAVAGGDAGGFRGLSREVGQAVCGRLGGNFLRNFYVTVDTPRGVFALRAYREPPRARDEYVRAGFTLEAAPEGAPHRYRVARVLPGSDAEAQGIHTGDAVVSVDGRPLDPESPGEADAALLGAPGDVRAVELERGTVRVRVEALLPEFPP